MVEQWIEDPCVGGSIPPLGTIVVPFMTKSYLKLGPFDIYVNLGVYDNERSEMQRVSVEFDVMFDKPPQGIRSDNYSDVICYAKIVEELHKKAAEKPYNLIEFLCNELHTTLKRHYQKVNLRVTKFPDIKKIYTPITFEIKEFTIC